MSRGLRNCNPGNIRHSIARFRGEVRPSRDAAFKEFSSLAWGYRAIFVVLNTYRKKHGLHTLPEMISRWAPPSENHTSAYIQAIQRMTGIPLDELICTDDEQTMIPLAMAISQVENGVPASRADVEAGWRLYRT